MSDAIQTMIDLRFPLTGGVIPLDYADALWMALRPFLPWLELDPCAGVHPIDGLSLAGEAWYLSRRSRLTLRITPAQAVEARAALEGRSLQVSAHHIELGVATERAIADSSVLYSKFVALAPACPEGRPIAEDVFLQDCKELLDRMGMRRPKLVCGLAQRAQTPAGLLSGFSLMLSDLEPEEIRRLQCEGLGVERKRGCGIFIPHKSGSPVVTLQ